MLLKQFDASSYETAVGAQVRIVTVLVPTLAWLFRQEFSPRLDNHQSNQHITIQTLVTQRPSMCGSKVYISNLCAFSKIYVGHVGSTVALELWPPGGSG